MPLTNLFPSSRRDHGFTLLELLVTLSLLVLITVYLLAGIGTGRRVWDTRTQIENRDASNIAREFLRQRIEDSWPAQKRLSSGEISLFFEGGEESIAFASSLGAGSNWSGLYWFEIKARRDTERAYLEISGDVFRSNGDTSRAQFQRTLLAPIKAVRFRYYGPDSSEDPPGWSSRWRPAQGLPWLVGISVDFPDGDPRQWTELIIPLRLAQR